jgi:colanic acid biosynthesis glycosyl transferase WcaI
LHNIRSKTGIRTMKVLIVTPYFPPELGAAQTRLYELAVRLAKLDHEVSVLTTFPSYPTGVVPPEWRGKMFWQGEVERVRIHRVWSYPAPTRALIKRVLGNLSFAISALVAGLLLPSADLIVVQSPPLFDGITAILLGKLKHKPYFFMVSDLWPESAIQMGMLRNRALIWALKKLELLSYRHSQTVLALTAGIRAKIVADGVAPEKVALFRAGVDCETFSPNANFNGIRRELGIGEKEFVALYAGTLGFAQNLSTILEAAELLESQGERSVRFVIAGDGAESDFLKGRAAELKLRSVRFVGSLAKAQMPVLVNAADCVLVPLRNLELFLGALPSKMFEAMACAKPVILGVAGEAADVLNEAGGGICIPPEDPAAICNAIRSLMADPERVRMLGDRGRAHAVRLFSCDARARQLSDLLTAASTPRAIAATTSRSGEMSDLAKD